MLGSGLSSGLGDGAALAELPARFDGAIWTNRIDRIGPLRKAAP
jgi:glycerophosphoryl diester phosphodiesterase